MVDIPKKPDLRHDPQGVAEYLVQEHGVDRALEVAVEGTAEAHQQGDFYTLSVWREVKRVLRERGDGGK